MALFGGYVYRTLQLFGGVQFTNLSPNSKGQCGKGPIVSSTTKRDSFGNHAHDSGSGVLCLQCVGIDHQHLGGKSFYVLFLTMECER